MIFNSPEDVLPWVGLYTAAASLICTLAMAADVIRAFWQWKMWFPNRFFTLNATTITLIAIAMKLPMDLATEMHDEVQTTKMFSMAFLVTMLANFLPSLGLMDGRELLMNMVALGILMITIVVNIGIQLDTLLFFNVASPLIFSILWPFSVAMTVSTTRKKLEHRYKESQPLVSCHQEKSFSYKEHKLYVKKYWMMAETLNPQFVIACSPVSSAFSVLCSILALSAMTTFAYTVSNRTHTKFGNSDYEWSMKIIFLVQLIGIVVGSIAPIFRCFTSISHYSLSKKWSKKQLNVFRVEKHWIQMLLHWKDNHVHSQITSRHCKIVFNNVKNTFLNFCIVLHIAVLVICKTICLLPRTFLILLSCSWYFFKSFFKRVANESTNNVSSEIEDYSRYIVQIEEDSKLSNKILRNTLHSITQLLDESEKKEPHNLMKLLEKSRGFSGVLVFDNDQVPPLYREENHNCWSLVLVTLTSIIIALPNIPNGQFKELLAGIREGLQFIRHIEESLNGDDDLINVRKAAICGWIEVEVYHTWLQIELQKKARKGKTSKEILKWLGDEAAQIVIQFKSNKKPSIDHSPYRFILACSMYRISQTILLHCNEQENLSNDEELLKWISTMIADILSACFTNLPRVITMKCHHHAIEKRSNNIRNAAQILGKSKTILKILKARQLPNIDLELMAYIDKWRVLTMSQIPDGDAYSISSVGIQSGSSSSNETLIITIM
ncbi:hypothetical protein L1987_62534 [Smallanthus sonchifolius]|uniref:Uncharacterized protein n=1 Tax=Smallanthus sonchifolius TaxID=185202 RepID=A0ACB9CAR4_9ASTR|nr:hypothetical protein L1987_62534 [Smallanthus sonchifolius]